MVNITNSVVTNHLAVRFNTIDEMRKCYAKYTGTKSNGGYGYRRVESS